MPSSRSHCIALMCFVGYSLGCTCIGSVLFHSLILMLGYMSFFLFYTNNFVVGGCRLLDDHDMFVLCLLCDVCSWG